MLLSDHGHAGMQAGEGKSCNTEKKKRDYKAAVGERGKRSRFKARKKRRGENKMSEH